MRASHSGAYMFHSYKDYFTNRTIVFLPLLLACSIFILFSVFSPWPTALPACFDLQEASLLHFCEYRDCKRSFIYYRSGRILRSKDV